VVPVHVSVVAHGGRSPRVRPDVSSDLTSERPRVRVEANPKWIRGVVDGVTVDTTVARLVPEVPCHPARHVPFCDVAAKLVANDGSVRSPSRGESTRYGLSVGNRTVVDVA